MRCGIELDEIDPAKWALLDAATDAYIIREDGMFDACARLLVHNMVDVIRSKFDVSTLALGAPKFPPLHVFIISCMHILLPCIGTWFFIFNTTDAQSHSPA